MTKAPQSITAKHVLWLILLFWIVYLLSSLLNIWIYSHVMDGL